MGLFTLAPRPPFRMDLTVWALRRQAHNQVDGWESETYRRVWRFGDHWLKLHHQRGLPDAPPVHSRPIRTGHLGLTCWKNTPGDEQYQG